jgi:hypothetical protein
LHELPGQPAPPVLGAHVRPPQLRKRVEKMLPKVDLPDLLFEVNAWTGFLDAFVHLGDGTTRMKDLSTSVVALLVSEACNIGLAPVVNPAHEALTRARLVHVDPKASSCTTYRPWTGGHGRVDR